MHKKTCKPGEVIFREGDESTEAYWITSGRVEISVRSGNGSLPVARLGQGEIIGEMGLIDDRPRSATATALCPTELDVITEEEFEHDVLKNPERLRTYLGALFERLRATNALLEMERIQNHIAAAQAGIAPLAVTASDEMGPEPVVTLTSTTRNPVTGDIVMATVDRFPFRIGRAGAWSPFVQNELLIADEKPIQISRNHALIENAGGKCFVRDRGSRIGTVVNGVLIGVRSDSLMAELKPGDNSVVFGNSASAHRYSVNVGEVR